MTRAASRLAWGGGAGRRPAAVTLQLPVATHSVDSAAARRSASGTDAAYSRAAPPPSCVAGWGPESGTRVSFTSPVTIDLFFAYLIKHLVENTRACSQHGLNGAHRLPGVADEERHIAQLRHGREELHVFGEPSLVLEGA